MRRETIEPWIRCGGKPAAHSCTSCFFAFTPHTLSRLRQGRKRRRMNGRMFPFSLMILPSLTYHRIVCPSSIHFHLSFSFASMCSLLLHVLLQPRFFAGRLWTSDGHEFQPYQTIGRLHYFFFASLLTTSFGNSLISGLKEQKKTSKRS